MTSIDDDQPDPLQDRPLLNTAASPVTQAELDDILNDPSLLPGERRERLEALAALHGQIQDIDRGDDRDFLTIQIADALAMLAGGGHEYGPAAGVSPKKTDD